MSTDQNDAPMALHDAHRELAKWLNEEQIKPIDKQALATVLQAVSQQQYHLHELEAMESRIDTYQRVLRAMEDRYMALVKRIANGLAMLPSPPVYIMNGKPGDATGLGCAALVAAEREACAQVCDSRWRSLSKDNSFPAANEAKKCGSAIRYKANPI